MVDLRIITLRDGLYIVVGEDGIGGGGGRWSGGKIDVPQTVTCGAPVALEDGNFIF